MHSNTCQTGEVPNKVAFSAMSKMKSKYAKYSCIFKKKKRLKERMYERDMLDAECKVTTFYKKIETPSSANKALSL